MNTQFKPWSPYDWLDKIKIWCEDEELLNNLTLSQKAKLSEKLSFFFIDVEKIEYNSEDTNSAIL